MNLKLKDKISNAHSLSYCGEGKCLVEYRNIRNLLEERLDKNRYDFFLKYYGKNEPYELTYSEFIGKVNFLSSLLISKGIGPEDRCAVLSHNHSDTVILYFALWNIGATAVPLNTGESDDRLDYILGNSSSKLVFTRDEYAGRAENIVKGKNIEIINFDGIEIGNKEDFPDTGYEVNHFTESMIVYTSGTTGNPK